MVVAGRAQEATRPDSEQLRTARLSQLPPSSWDLLPRALLASRGEGPRHLHGWTISSSRRALPPPPPPAPSHN